MVRLHGATLAVSPSDSDRPSPLARELSFTATNRHSACHPRHGNRIGGTAKSPRKSGAVANGRDRDIVTGSVSQCSSNIAVPVGEGPLHARAPQNGPGLSQGFSRGSGALDRACFASSSAQVALPTQIICEARTDSLGAPWFRIAQIRRNPGFVGR